MNHKRICLVLAVVVATGWCGPAWGQGKDWNTWVEFTIVRITDPPSGSTVPVGKTITLRCVASIDIDCGPTGEWSPSNYVEDWLTFTWSATRGTLLSNTGTEVQWTAPANTTPDTVYITVTASDDSIPTEYANDTDRTHTITVKLVNPGIVYVDDTAAGLNDGTSWANAYTNLNTAITNAPANSELWVATGTYKPNSGSRGNSIAINKDLKIYGGFAGSETALYQRDWVANPTVLSGDIGVQGNDSDNSYRVVTISSGLTVLDGFTVTKGRGVSTDGAGTYITNASPAIRNCTFVDNAVSGTEANGGGMAAYNGSSPTVVKCVFLNNQSTDDGAGLSSMKNSSGTFIDCAFSGNVSATSASPARQGGAIHVSCGEEAPYIASSPTFMNCVIANNGNTFTQYGGGAAVCGTLSIPPVSSPRFFNCTFAGNNASTASGAISCRDGNLTTVIGNIIGFTIGLDYDELFLDAPSTINVSYSDVETRPASGTNISSNPHFAKPGDPDGEDNLWLTCDDGLRIRFDSPCIDRGNGDAKDGFSEADAQGSDALGLKHIDFRTVSNLGGGTPNYFDMGAYEANVRHVVFISVDGLSALRLQNDPELMAGTGYVPNMERIESEGMWTYNARCDYFNSTTTANHLTMLTGRPCELVAGWPSTSWHGWLYDGALMDQTWAVHHEYFIGGAVQGNPDMAYQPSVFDVVHDNGGTTAEYAGKTKFCIHEWTWDLVDGAYHATYGRDKIDTFEFTHDDVNDPWIADWDSWTLMPKFIDWMGTPEYGFNFVFLHLKGPDKYGHAHGWDSDEVKWTIWNADYHLGTVMNMVTNPQNKEWYYNSMIVFTADHGGPNAFEPNQHNQHNARDVAYNYTIPFGVWGHLIPQGDPYYYSRANRTNPGTGWPDYSGTQPIRHADGVDLALNVMGLPSISGAVIKDMTIRE